jgi:hypothetical protein
MTLLINIQINLLFKRKFPIGLTSKFGNLVWPNARAALVLSVSPMFYTGFDSLNSVDGLCFRSYYSFHSFAIQLIQVPLVAISHRMARLVIIGADDAL